MNRLIPYTTVSVGGQDEITEKKSRFIATVKPVSSEAEALDFIASMKKKYWDARHNCSAYIIGVEHPLMRCSDDGEPAQTAGRPMIDVLEGAGLRNVCIVVTRYFGGILLGTGGLIRAYTAAAKKGLAASTIILREPGFHVKITCDYPLIGKLLHLISSQGLTCADTTYTDTVTMDVPVPTPKLDAFEASVTEISNARVSFEISAEMYLN